MNILFTSFNGYNNTSNVIIKKISDNINKDTLLFKNLYEQIDKQLEKINIDRLTDLISNINIATCIM